MDATLSGLVALGVVMGVIAIGIRLSLYLFSQDAAGTLRFPRRLSLADETLPSHSTYITRRARHHRIPAEDKAHSSSRYVQYSLLAIALFILLAVMVIVVILAGMMH